MKKILLALLIAVVAFTFVGCPQVGGLGIKWNSAAGGPEAYGVASIDYENYPTEEKPEVTQQRGIRFLTTKHADMTCDIEISDVEKAGNSVMGIAFGAVDNADKTKTFALAGFNVQNNKVVYYVSVYKNIVEEKINSENLGVKDGYGTETIIKDFNGVTSIVPVDNKVNVTIGIDEDECGNYIVTFANGDNSYTVDIPYSAFEGRSGVFNKELIQGKIGFYANVYKETALKGTWTVTDIEGNPIPLEWADTEAHPLIK